MIINRTCRTSTGNRLSPPPRGQGATEEAIHAHSAQYAAESWSVSCPRPVCEQAETLGDLVGAVAGDGSEDDPRPGKFIEGFKEQAGGEETDAGPPSRRPGMPRVPVTG
jgi:hypothetical protein